MLVMLLTVLWSLVVDVVCVVYAQAAASTKQEADDARENLAAALGRANARIAELTSKYAQVNRYR